MESATKAAKVLSPPTQLRKIYSTVKDLTSVVMGNKQPDLPVVDDSVCESAVGSKEKNVFEGSKSGGLAGDTSFVGELLDKKYAFKCSEAVRSKKLN